MLKEYGNLLDENIPITEELLIFAKANNYKISLRTGYYHQTTPPSFNPKDFNRRFGNKLGDKIELVQAVHNLYVDGKCHLPSFYEVLGFTNYEAINTMFKKNGLRVLSIKETRHTYKEIMDQRVKETFKANYGVVNPTSLDSVKQKAKATNIEKYGTDNPMKTEAVKAKVRKTVMERHGGYTLQVPELRAKTIQTQIERYGEVQNYASETHRAKVDETMIAKYGVTNPSNSPELCKKREQTMLERFNETTPFKNEEVKRKIRETNIRKYGVENPYQIQRVRDKSRETSIKKYGAPYPLLNPDIRDKAKQAVVEKYGVHTTLLVPEVRDKITQTNIEKYGTPFTLSAPAIRDKIYRTKMERTGAHHHSLDPEKGEEYFRRYQKLQEFRLAKEQGVLNKEECEAWILNSDWSASSRSNLLKELCDRESTTYATELQVANFLDDLSISYIRNAKKLHGVKHNTGYHDMDFYFPGLGLGIEVNGLAYHSVNIAAKDNPKTKDYHFEKFLKFHESGIKVISFTDWDLYNRWDSVKNIIKHHLLGEEIEESTKVEFPDLYQSLNYGLFDYNKFEEKLQLTQNFEDFVEAKFIDGFEYWDCGAIEI